MQNLQVRLCNDKSRLSRDKLCKLCHFFLSCCILVKKPLLGCSKDKLKKKKVYETSLYAQIATKSCLSPPQTSIQYSVDDQSYMYMLGSYCCIFCNGCDLVFFSLRNSRCCHYKLIHKGCLF